MILAIAETQYWRGFYVGYYQWVNFIEGQLFF